MKFLIVVAFLAIIVAAQAVNLTEEQKAKAKVHVDACREEIKITDDELAKLRTNALVDPSQDVMCFTNCFFEKAGIIKDGVIQETSLLEKYGELVGEENAKEVLTLCGGEKGANKCETAYKVHTCFVKNKAVVE